MTRRMPFPAVFGAVLIALLVRVFRGLADPVGAAETPRGSAAGAGRLPRVPQGRLDRGAQAVRHVPPLPRFHQRPRDLRAPGAEPVLLVPCPGVLPDVPRREGGAEAEREDGRPAGSHGAASGGLPRHPPDRRAPRPRVVLPVPREQERRAGASSATGSVPRPFGTACDCRATQRILNGQGGTDHAWFPESAALVASSLSAAPGGRGVRRRVFDRQQLGGGRR